MSATSPKLSFVVPFYNEEGNVAPVIAEIQACYPGAEIIAVDDGSSDATWEVIASLPGVTGLRLGKNCGQSGALYAGLLRATGQVLVTLDGDGQNPVSSAADLIAALERCDFAIGQRRQRRDIWSKRIASRAANRIRRLILADGASDSGCGLKAMRREVLPWLIPFNGLHRYFPALLGSAGFRVAEVPVDHRERASGVSKYNNLDRALRGVADLFGVRWWIARRVRPEVVDSTAPADEVQG